METRRLSRSQWLVWYTRRTTHGLTCLQGITVGLISSLIQSAGLTLQRKSHLINESLPEEEKRPERKRPYVLRPLFSSLYIPYTAHLSGYPVYVDFELITPPLTDFGSSVSPYLSHLTFLDPYSKSQVFRSSSSPPSVLSRCCGTHSSPSSSWETYFHATWCLGPFS